MKLTLRLIENLQRLQQGETISYSSLPKSLADSLTEEGLLSVLHHRSRRSLRTPNPDAFSGALPRYNEALRDLEAAAMLLTEDSSRSAQASISGNSKTRSERSCPGFLVNSFQRIDCKLGNYTFAIEPTEGSAVYIADWESFIPPVSALIIGVENMENFLKIRNQKDIFAEMMNEEEKEVLFAARYAFSSDLTDWLASLPNRYLHFGDFDLAGIDIFLKQFKPHVGERGNFLIPSDIESRLKQGSRKRYDEQYQRYSNLTDSDPAINHLISLIHKYRRTYDQEGYILNNLSFASQLKC